MPFTYGVMQGRLSPPEPGRFQAFPRTSWRDEFRLAMEAGFSYIEWIHDEYDKGANPIFSESGLLEMDALKKEYGISTPALCGDWFMDFPLIRCSKSERRRREEHLWEIIPGRISGGNPVFMFRREFLHDGTEPD